MVVIRRVGGGKKLCEKKLGNGSIIKTGLLVITTIIEEGGTILFSGPTPGALMESGAAGRE